jgi:hypothetical protein
VFFAFAFVLVLAFAFLVVILSSEEPAFPIPEPSMPRRSKPLTIAPLIPLLAIIGLVGVNQLHGTRFLIPFVVLWCLLLTALFIYVFNKMMEAKRARSGR